MLTSPDEEKIACMKKEVVGTCDKCKGSGLLTENTICKCLKEFRIRHRLYLGGFGEEFFTFTKRKVDNRIHLSDKDKAIVDHYSDNMDIVDLEGLSIYIYGTLGLGKNTLATVLAREYISYFLDEEHYKVNLEVVFMSGTEFFHLLGDKYGGGDKRLKKAWDAHFFVYDEFGRRGEFDDEVKSREVEDFLRYRRRNKLATIFCANKPVDEIEGVFKSLFEISDEGRMEGRTFRSVELKGFDIRTGDRGKGGWEK